MDQRIPLMWENKISVSHKMSLLREEYTKLPRKLLKRVYKTYLWDYELFGYDFNRVLFMAGQKPLEEDEEQE